MSDNFQVAISLSDENTWIAEDLHSFLKELGIRSFFYKSDPDYTQGKLMERIREIYRFSSLNVIVWSAVYANKGYDSVVSTELQEMEERHIRNSEYETLLIINRDNTPIHTKFRDIVFHNLNEIGIYKTRNLIISRLNNLYTYKETNDNLKMYHPDGDKKSRGFMTLCKFKIHNRFKTDKKGCWNKYGDILVTVLDSTRQIDKGIGTYLIPSGRATSLISHTHLLLSQPNNLNIKKNLTERFVSEFQDKKLTGYLFYRFNEDIDYPYIYCFEYDDYLNRGLMEYRYR